LKGFWFQKKYTAWPVKSGPKKSIEACLIMSVSYHHGSGSSSSGGGIGGGGNAAPGSQYRIPDELQEILLDFTVNYLIEQPSDIARFGVEYFVKLTATRTNKNEDDHSDDESMLSDEEIRRNGLNIQGAARRKSVFAETYDPEEDEQDDQSVIYPKSDLQRKALKESVKEILLFRSLEPDQLNEVLDAMFEYKVKSGDNIIRQGDDGDNFYVVESGLYNIYVTTANGNQLVGKCENSGSFGELALMYNMPRAATIQASVDGTLWALDRQTFRRIVLRNAFQKRKMYEALIENVPLLSALSDYERMNVADALIPKTYASGEVIVRQGDAADGMFFLEGGICEVYVESGVGNRKKVSDIEKGGYFGELALVTHKPRAATVVAQSDVRLAFLDVNAFERLLGPCMELMKRNINDYEQQLLQIFGSKTNISDVR